LAPSLPGTSVTRRVREQQPVSASRARWALLQFRAKEALVELMRASVWVLDGRVARCGADLAKSAVLAHP
jgi:hypothetical protein